MFHVPGYVYSEIWQQDCFPWLPLFSKAPIIAEGKSRASCCRCDVLLHEKLFENKKKKSMLLLFPC